MLDQVIEGLKQRHVDKAISPDAYRKWRSSGVTNRLMEELELTLIEYLTADDPMSDNDQIVRDAVKKQVVKEAFEQVLNWKPQELLSDED